jgi:hypothetical protein
MVMPEQLQPLQPSTISFTQDEAYWLYLALRSSKLVLAEGLLEKGAVPAKDETYKAYDALEERCLAFWMVQSDPDK